MQPSHLTPASSPHGAATTSLAVLVVAVMAAATLVSCAKMGKPDGGWYDETPPKVIATLPLDGSTDVDATTITIYFDEYVTIDNATENVVVSPPQLESPEIKEAGKRIVVKLNDTLRANTTYTVDFSDAIADNNEGNPLGNYTYSFATGDHIDTLQVAGYVLEAQNLEPVKGILVGLYDNMSDTAFVTTPFLRVARTDASGRFVIKGVAGGTYRICALQDADGNYMFSQKSEMIAYSHDSITPTWRPDIRQDTLWTDSLHIRDIVCTPYTHFLPDEIALRAFTETATTRYFIKQDRTENDRFTLYFSYADTVPQLRGLNFDATRSLLVEASEHNDTVTYWITDTTLVEQDTLEVEISYAATDTLGALQQQTDTLTLIPRRSLERRQKDREKAYEDWKKDEERKRKRGEPYDTVMPPERVKLTLSKASMLDPDKNVTITTTRPIATIDTASIHLYAKIDTIWAETPFDIVTSEQYRLLNDTLARPKTRPDKRSFVILGDWMPGTEYSLEIDSAAFTDIHGRVNLAEKKSLKVKQTEEYGTLQVNISGSYDGLKIVQLLDNRDAVVKQRATDTGSVTFHYVAPGTYYLRLIIDRNRNGQWDTGIYATDTQPEEVYYYHESIECRAKWDMTRDWNPLQKPLFRQKPGAITTQKADKKTTVQQRNAERARKLGIEYVP